MQKLHLLPPLEVAEQLLLDDSYALRKIRSEELEDESWLGEKKNELSPNITEMVEHFNRIALLVPTEILAEDTSKMRAKVICAFIRIAEVCHQLKNYHSLKAVLAGLQCTPVYRLKKTWKRVPSSRINVFHSLSNLMAEEGDCMLYRKAIHQDLQSCAPFVPYLGFFLTQVVHRTCLGNMPRDKRMRRKGAMIKRYKITLSAPDLSRERKKSSFSCLNGSLDFKCPPKLDLNVLNPADGTAAMYNGGNGSDKCPAILISQATSPTKPGNGATLSYHCVQHVPRAYSISSLLKGFHRSKISPSSRSSLATKPMHRSAESLLSDGPYDCIQGSSARLPDSIGGPDSFNPEVGLDPVSSDSLLDAPLHQVKRCNSIEEEGNQVLDHQYLRMDSQTTSIRSTSPSDAESGRNSPLQAVSDDERFTPSTMTQFSRSMSASNSSEEECSGAKVSHFGAHYSGGQSSSGSHDYSEASTLPRKKESLKESAEREGAESLCSKSPLSGNDFTKNSHCFMCPSCAQQVAYLGSRRQAMQVALWDSSNFQDVKALLHVYQICSLGCGICLKERVHVRSLIREYHCNTEAENYALSYRREPQVFHAVRKAAETEIANPS